MGIKQNLKKIFSTQTETTEEHHDKRFQTRYYKAMPDKAIEELKQIFERGKGFEIRDYSEERGELIVNVKQGKRALMVVTVIMVRPYRTAIDFSVATDTFLFSDFGYSGKMIEVMYSELDQRLTYVGTGLAKEMSTFR
ncbi:hypothetical protein [Salisediminibacterium selenitireducens]|uniref:DUF1499 domain-containing protein n=1 Tax=Bacillus selenitireducens (strain ATCC 700615 / DSM 15326 / MLS10) TaxID=439292 RepID=D6XST9_BACIE|nr:hypothetical protein [Salisediminibacterium selenitireducens]ADH98875.1 hypothetical protein Bsel_1363 [[Bacillus] selenitireducens MLS10]